MTALAAAMGQAPSRELVEAAGGTADAGPDREGVVRPSRPALIAGGAAALVSYTAVFGALTLAMDGDRITVAHIVARGAVFGVGMTVVNLTVIRRRNERAAGR